MKKINLTESDLKRIIHKILEQQEPPNEDEGRMDPVSLRATADHIIQVYRSLLDDIDYLKEEMDNTQRSNLHPKDKEYLTGLWIRVLELIHEDTRPPSEDEDDQDY
jgi:hypothetical protein